VHGRFTGCYTRVVDQFKPFDAVRDSALIQLEEGGDFAILAGDYELA
jgi:hypothetical protein